MVLCSYGSRYREELLSGAEIEAAILTTLEQAGHTVIMSGSTLAFAFAMMTLFPVELLFSLGVGASIAGAGPLDVDLNSI